MTPGGSLVGFGGPSSTSKYVLVRQCSWFSTRFGLAGIVLVVVVFRSFGTMYSSSISSLLPENIT